MIGLQIVRGKVFRSIIRNGLINSLYVWKASQDSLIANGSNQVLVRTRNKDSSRYCPNNKLEMEYCLMIGVELN